MKKQSIPFLVLAAALLATPAALAQKAYPTADAAAEAFTDALRKYDREALRVVLGNDWKRYVPVQNVGREEIDIYLAAWDKAHKVYTEKGGEAILQAGDSGWTLPIPIVQTKAGWRFDPKAGTELMRERLIGRNELSAMQAALAYVDAQRDYAAKDHDGNGVLEYAQKFGSTPGKHDGLYWDDRTGSDPSPLGPRFARDKASGGEGYHGYHFKILKAQGKDAPGGAYDYVIGGRMRAGFALVAWPVKYGETGVMTFMVNHAGKLVEKDLGPNTAAIVAKMTRFNPDGSWKVGEIQAK